MVLVENLKIIFLFFRENREGKSVWQYSLQQKKSRKLALSKGVGP